MSMPQPSDPAERSVENQLPRILAVARELSASADLDQILTVIIDAIRDLLQAERASVFEYDPVTDELFATVAHGLSGGAEDSGHEIRFPASAGIAGECVQSRRVINVPDAQCDPRFNADVDRKTGFCTRALLAIPLVSYDGTLIGVAQVLNKPTGVFTEADEQIAVALASQAAVAMKRGRLIEDRMVREKLERDLELAREIQQQSFPKSLPRLAGFDLEAWSDPAEETGGDTYDVVGFASQCAETRLVQQDGVAERVILLMADATGHGVGPALSVTQVRSMLRMAARMAADLPTIATNMNRQLWEDLPGGRFITAWLGELDATTAVLRSFSAGQGPLLHYRAAQDTIDELSADTVPLGVVDELPNRTVRELPLGHGDIFAVISDGLFEATNRAGEECGGERLSNVLRTHHHESAKEIADALRDAVTEHLAGEPATDDCTVVIVKRVGEESASQSRHSLLEQ